MNVKFSIITISYNSDKTVNRTIHSVLNQTYQNYEYIIVDGNSKDGTVGIIKESEPLFDGKMRWISEPDNGIYNAMNKGIKMASGDIIGIVNSDDWLEPDALEIVNNSFTANNGDTNILYCGAINYHCRSGNVKRWDVKLKSFRRQAPLYIMAGIRHPAVFVPRNVYDTIGLFNERMRLSADQDFILRCYYGGVGFVDVKAVLSNMSEGGVSTDNSQQSMKKSEEDRRIMLSEFGKHGLSYSWLWYSWKIRCFVRGLIYN